MHESPAHVYCHVKIDAVPAFREEGELLPELSRLIDLQEIDREILELSRDLERLPQELADLARTMEDTAAEQAVRVQMLEDLGRQHRETEAEMADLEASIKASRIRLMEIKKDLEYRAMLKEIAFQEDQRDQKETRILELLEAMESQRQEMAGLKEQLAADQELYGQKESEAKVLMADLQERLAVLEKQRQGIRKAIPATLLKRYEFIRQRHNSTTLAEVSDGVCLGCHMNILPQQFIDLQKGAEILQCPNCQRILYWLGEAEENAGEAPTENKPSRRASKG
jgi:predicted  nucleic acid-binding Zn-ribbon protein